MGQLALQLRHLGFQRVNALLQAFRLAQGNRLGIGITRLIACVRGLKCLHQRVAAQQMCPALLAHAGRTGQLNQRDDAAVFAAL